MKLIDCEEGRTYTIIGYGDISKEIVAHIRNLGLYKSNTVTVISKVGSGVIISFLGTRLLLEKSFCNVIEVRGI